MQDKYANTNAASKYSALLDGLVGKAPLPMRETTIPTIDRFNFLTKYVPSGQRLKG